MGRWAGAAVATIPRRIGILGGTFDPIHVGHLHAADRAARRLSLDLVVFVVAGAPWQKKGYADAEDRYLMAVAATASDPRFVVSRVEIDRRGPTYTVDTLELLRDFYGASVDLYLIMGADAAAALHTWHRVDVLRSLARIAVVTRPGVDTTALKDAGEGSEVVIIDEAEVDVSATDVRRAVAAGHLPAASLPVAVGAYIQRKGLYGR